MTSIQCTHGTESLFYSDGHDERERLSNQTPDSYTQESVAPLLITFSMEHRVNERFDCQRCQTGHFRTMTEL